MSLLSSALMRKVWSFLRKTCMCQWVWQTQNSKIELNPCKLREHNTVIGQYLTTEEYLLALNPLSTIDCIQHQHSILSLTMCVDGKSFHCTSISACTVGYHAFIYFNCLTYMFLSCTIKLLYVAQTGGLSVAAGPILTSLKILYAAKGLRITLCPT